MSQTTHCDICQAVIKYGISKFLLGIQEITETNEPQTNNKFKKDVQEYLVKHYEKQFERIPVYEICKTCKKILNYLFKMKKEERAKILKTLENMYTQEPRKKKGWGK